MKKPFFTVLSLILLLIVPACQQSRTTPEILPPETIAPSPTVQQSEPPSKTPRIASWLAKKEEIIAGQKPYDLVMTGWFTPEEAAQIRHQNPDVILLAGLTINWVWDNPDWMTFLMTVAGYGKESPLIITEDMYLHDPDGGRCPFGWASDSWGHEEIYAMDPRNEGWIEIVTSFYKNVLDQPQHDGIIIDMVLEKSLFPDVISDRDWTESTKKIMAGIQDLNTYDKLVVFNSGRDITEIDAYGEFMDGYLMENFMGEQLKTSFEDGLQAAGTGYFVIYAVDTDDSGSRDLNKMRLGLVLSLLNDNAYFTYDFGPRDHGQAWWFSEYEVDLGKPLGQYYRLEEAYYRDFENGSVVASPYYDTTVTFDSAHIDITSGDAASIFHINNGDGRIYLKAE